METILKNLKIFYCTNWFCFLIFLTVSILLEALFHLTNPNSVSKQPQVFVVLDFLEVMETSDKIC